MLIVIVISVLIVCTVPVFIITKVLTKHKEQMSLINYSYKQCAVIKQYLTEANISVEIGRPTEALKNKLMPVILLYIPEDMWPDVEYFQLKLHDGRAGFKKRKDLYDSLAKKLSQIKPIGAK